MTTHSGHGQGDEGPYEGVVLPANGDPWTPGQQTPPPAPQPAQGQPWGQPWGPDTDYPSDGQGGPPQAPPQAPAQAPPPPTAAPQMPAAPPLAPPPPTAPPQPGGPPAYDGGSGYGYPPVPGGGDADSTQYLPPQPGGALPPGAPGAQPGYGYPPPQYGGQPPSGGPGEHGGPGGQPGYGYPQVSAGGGAGQLPAGSGGQPQPGPQPGYGYPPQPGGDADSTQMLPPLGNAGPSYGGAHAAPSAGDAESTQYLAPQPAAPSAPAGPAAPGDAESTQMLPPFAGTPGGEDPATAMLRAPLPPETAGGAQAAAAGPPPGSGPYGIRPGGPETRQPPAEFDSLFRTESAAPNEPAATQGLPIFDHAAAQHGQHGQHGQQGGGYEPQGRAARRTADREHGRSGMSPTVLISVGVAAIVIVGLITGAALSGGGEEDKAPVGAEGSSAPPEEGKSSAAPDPAAQAKQLDKLLESSNNSRTSVIRSVQNIKACKKLGQAATDLRAAAQQRSSLVTRLKELETGAIPSSEALNSALTRAWKASAKADNAYAAWAGQVAGKKGCHKGKARSTQQHAQGNRASGEATAAKKKAAGLWNPTAEKYGLSKRQVTQL